MSENSILNASSSSTIQQDVYEPQLMAEKKAPRAQVWTLMALVAIMPFSFELIFPFVNQFLLEIGVVTDPADAGFYSGVTESVFAVAQLLTVFPATRLSDLYGRKPIVLFGSLGVGISTALFGLSTKYWMMVLFRILAGVVGGSNTAIRVMGSEMAYTKEEESWIITFITVSYRFGQVVGQPVGGVLSHPERRWPGLFGGPFWRAHPYALPCFVGAAYVVICVVVGWVVLKETLPSKQPSKNDAASSAESGEATPLLIQISSAVDKDPPGPPFDSTASTTVKPDNATATASSSFSVLTWPLISLLLSTSAMALITEIFFAVYPLFAFTPISLGGLGLSEAQIGLHMSARSFMLILTLFFYTPLTKRKGLLGGMMGVYRLGTIAWVPTILLFPVLNWIAKGNVGGEDGVFWYLTLFLVFAVWSITGLQWPSVFLLSSNHSVNPESKATVQGFVSTAIIISQSIGPALGTSLFAVSANHPDILNGWLFWVITLGLALIATLHSFSLVEGPTETQTGISTRDVQPTSGQETI